MNKGLKITAGLLAVFVTVPIWYYLIYKILVMINATELMFFLFWVYLPVGIFCNILIKISEVK